MADRRLSLFGSTITIQGLITFASAVDSVLMSRALAPPGRGAYVVVITVVTTAQVIGFLSIANGQTYLWSEGESRLANGQTYLWSEGESRRSLVANGVLLATLLGVVVGLGTWFIAAGPARTSLHIAHPYLLAIALGSVPFGLAFNYLTNLFVLGDRLARVNAANVLGAGVELVAVISLFAARSLTVLTMVLVWLGSVCIPAIILLYTARPRPADVSWPLLRRTLSIGARFHTGSLFLYLLLDVDILLLSARVDRSQVGLYSLAVTLAEMVFLVNSVISQVMQPHQASRSLPESGRLTVRLVRISFIAAAVTIGLVLICSPFVIPLIYGSAYRGCIPALAALGPGVIAFGGIQLVGVYLVRLNRPATFAALTGGAMILNVVLNLLLIPRIGIVGSSVASSVAYGALAIAYLYWLRKSIGVSPRAFLPRRSDFAELFEHVRSRRPGVVAGNYSRAGSELLPRSQPEASP